MAKHGLTRLALVPLVAFGLGACDDESGSPTGEGTGQMSILLTDAPGDFLQAYVTIDEIVLMGDVDGDIEDGDAETNGRIILRDESWTGDLLELQGEVDELVSDAVVPVGTYSQLRFVISAGCIEVETETGSDVYASEGFTACGEADGELHMPSWDASGLKVKLPNDRFTMTEGQKIVLVDFDVSESFGHAAGNSGRWIMEPVLEATEVQFSGNIGVEVALADTVTLPEGIELADFGIVVDGESPQSMLGGGVSLDFLLPGTHTIDLRAPEGYTVTTDPELPLELDLSSGASADVDIVITSITAVEEEG